MISPDAVVEAGTGVVVTLMGYVTRRVAKWTDRLERKVEDAKTDANKGIAGVAQQVHDIDVRVGRVEGAVSVSAWVEQHRFISAGGPAPSTEPPTS